MNKTIMKNSDVNNTNMKNINMINIYKKLILTLTLITIVLLALTACSGYPSKYKTTMCVRTNDSDSASLSFSTFEGTESFKLSTKESGTTLKYSAKLDKGTATIYYDDDGTKKELFTIKAGETVDSKIENLNSGKLYIIFETDGKCEEGKFEFELE